MDNDNVVNFGSAGDKVKQQRELAEKEHKVEKMRQRFAAAFPEKPTPVKDYLTKKRAKKKR